jgi:hypothetical protein
LEIIKRFRTDIILGLILLITFCVYAFFMVGHQSYLIIDVGRETYIPWQMLKGQVLYKDIVNIYGPLAYQINAFLYLIFGQNLNTLYMSGLVNSLILLASFYLISRLLASPLMSFSLTFSVLSVCVFNYYIFNFIFPYTYAAVYALSSFLLSLLFACYYLKYSSKVFIYLSFFFMGFSIVSKYEYTLFTIVLLLIVLFLKKINLKELMICVGLLLLMPLLSFAVLFLQGMSISDFIKAVELVKNICTSHTLNFFYTYSGYFFSPTHLEQSFSNLITAFLGSIVPFTLIYLALHYSEKIKNLIAAKKNIWMLYAFLYGMAITVTFCLFVKYVFSETLFGWLPLSTSILMITLIVVFSKKGYRNITLNDKLYFLILSAALIASSKSYFSLNTHLYGTFMFPLVILVNVFFVSEYLSKLIEINNPYKWRNAWALYFLFISLAYSAIYFGVARAVYIHPIKSEKGSIYTTAETGRSVNELIDYVKTSVPEGKGFLVMPEGVMLNFLTGRDSDNKYYSLLPLNIESFGESNIINDLKKNPPDYIFINNRNTSDYGFKHICNDYAFNLCSYIVQNYQFEKMIGSDLKIKIYKFKNTN